MPAILEDPSTRNPPPKAHTDAAPTLTARKTTLPKFSSAPMTLYPITGGPQTVPKDLIKFLHEEFSAEILRGGTYPMMEPMALDQFADYWFGTFAVVAILDDEGQGLREGRDWKSVCMGTFYTKPNYPGMWFSVMFGCNNLHCRNKTLTLIGRCSHVCNGGFLTTTAARGKGVGQAMGEAYLDFAPRLVRLAPLRLSNALGCCCSIRHRTCVTNSFRRDTHTRSSTWFLLITRPPSASGRS